MRKRWRCRAALGTGAVCVIGAVLLAGCLSTDAARGPGALRSAFPSTRKIREVGVAGRRSYVAEGPKGALGYAVERRVVSRSGPFTILVIVDRKFRVKRVEVLSYPGERGGEVRSLQFRQQFVGKGPEDPIRVSKDIDAVTGATISSRAMADGVREAMRLLESQSAAEGGIQGSPR